MAEKNEYNERDYANMSIQELTDTIIEDCRRAGTLTFPLRKEGYHKCTNMQLSSFK